MFKDRLHIYWITYSYWFKSDPNKIYEDCKRIVCRNEEFIKSLMYFEFDLREDVGNNYRIDSIINSEFELEMQEYEN